MCVAKFEIQHHCPKGSVQPARQSWPIAPLLSGKSIAAIFAGAPRPYAGRHLQCQKAKYKGGNACCGFHATEDKQYVRDNVFAVLANLDFGFDVTLIEKREAQPQVRPDEPTLFKYAWFYHLKYLAPQAFLPGDEALIIAAELGTKRTRQAFRGAIEDVMTQCLPYRVKRTLAFWRDESDVALQAADYLTWAVMRFYERNDSRSYDLIKHKINAPYDLFKIGTKYYF